MKVWMLTHSGEGMPTNTILFREEHPPSTERVEEFFYQSLNYKDASKGARDWHKKRSTEMASAISKQSYWVDKSGYEGADLTLVDVHDG